MTSFADTMRGVSNSKDRAITENGALALATSQPPYQKERVGGRLDLYFQAVRGLSAERLQDLLAVSWEESPLDTLRIIFHSRDCRGGKGERLLFRFMLQWVARKDPEIIRYNLHLIPLFGRWDDVLFLPGGVQFMARQLMVDRKNMLEKQQRAAAPSDDSKTPRRLNISLAAKWAPTEGKRLDKKYKFVSALVKALSTPGSTQEAKGAARTDYRKLFLTPLRKEINLVERAMCRQEWDTIDYSKVPSRAMKNYAKAFALHDSDGRFAKWKAALARDDKTTEDGQVVKVNAKQVYPHELVKQVLNAQSVDPVVEAQWQVLQQQTAELGNIANCLCVCDVSESMTGEPMMVAIALGLLISSQTAPPFQNQIIEFSTTPHFFEIVGKTLHERVAHLKKAPWGGSTNLQAVFDLILERVKRFRVAPADMPRRMYILSDMQFDVACGGNAYTNLEVMTAKYRQAGYVRPEVVFWNLRAPTTNSSMPAAARDAGVALVSGFSPSVLKALLNGEDITPWSVLRNILDDRRYACVTLPPCVRHPDPKGATGMDIDTTPKATQSPTQPPQSQPSATLPMDVLALSDGDNDEEEFDMVDMLDADEFALRKHDFPEVLLSDYTPHGTSKKRKKRGGKR